MNSIRTFKVRSINLPEVFRLKLMTLNTNNNGLLAIDCFPINLKQIKITDERVIHRVQCWTWQLLNERSYGANSTGVVLLDVGPQGCITGVPPWPQSWFALMGLRVAGFLSQVVKLEGDLVVRVKVAAITQVSMLRYQDLQGTQTETPAFTILFKCV